MENKKEFADDTRLIALECENELLNEGIEQMVLLLKHRKKVVNP